MEAVDEYEYEYDENETETFLVDVDFSSLNGVIKSNNQGSRKALQKPKRDDDPEHDPSQDATPIPEEADPDVSQPQTPGSTIGSLKLRGLQRTTNLQILDFHTHNPIISYQKELYSCTWADMIGTNMFFSNPDPESPMKPLRNNDDYDLVGTSRIRLIGHKSNTTDRTGSRKRGRPAERQAAFLEKLMDVATKKARGQEDVGGGTFDSRTKFADTNQPSDD